MKVFTVTALNNTLQLNPAVYSASLCVTSESILGSFGETLVILFALVDTCIISPSALGFICLFATTIYTH